MEEKIETQEFGSNNILNNILYNFILDHDLQIEGKTSDEISKKFVKRIIEKYSVNINGGTCTRSTERIVEGDIIEIAPLEIRFIAKMNSQYVDNEPKSDGNKIERDKIIFKHHQSLNNKSTEESSESTELTNTERSGGFKKMDGIIEQLLNDNFGVSITSNVPHNEFKKAFCLIVKLFQDKGFTKVCQSSYSYELTDFVKDRVNDSNLCKELTFSKQQLSSSGMLIEKLLVGKGEKEAEFRDLINELINCKR